MFCYPYPCFNFLYIIMNQIWTCKLYFNPLNCGLSELGGQTGMILEVITYLKNEMQLQKNTSTRYDLFKRIHLDDKKKCIF